MKFLYTGSNLGTSTYMPIVCHHSSGWNHRLLPTVARFSAS